MIVLLELIGAVALISILGLGLLGLVRLLKKGAKE